MGCFSLFGTSGLQQCRCEVLSTSPFRPFRKRTATAAEQRKHHLPTHDGEPTNPTIPIPQEQEQQRNTARFYPG